MRTFCLILFLTYFLQFGNSSYAQISIQLPAIPTIDPIPAEWRGFNEGAKNQISELQTTEYYDAVTAMDPGIIRWPGGNYANNYRWDDHINDMNQLHVVNFADYSTTFGTEMQIVVNFGNGTAHEAAEFVRFCNSTEPFYQNWRDEVLGSNTALNIQHWEIGNESSDAWSFAWSWLGFQDWVKYRTGDQPKQLFKPEQDSLYYYGGCFWRDGWVNAEGGLNSNSAILGTTKFYSQSHITDTIKVEYPNMDTLNTNSVRVFLTSGFNSIWAHEATTTQQQIYDSIANPANLLSAQELEWNDTHVIITPYNGIDSSDAVLIEYNSIGHDGAFEFRDSMKIADPGIEVGYNVKLTEDLYTDTLFMLDFANSPPDFMIRHPYASGLTIPALEAGLYSESLYVSEKKVKGFIEKQQRLDQLVADWNIPNSIGQSLTEWNIALYDEAPPGHPIKGIASGMYVADFWAHCFEYAQADSFDLRLLNHFALSASGNNFIHLLHTNNPLSVGVEGMTTAMVMESIGRGLFPVSIDNNPILSIITNVGQNIDTVDAPAIQAWGGVGNDTDLLNILIINRDDESAHNTEIHIPPTWMVDSVFTHSIFGTMSDTTILESHSSEPLIGSYYSLDLPIYSVTSVKLYSDSSLVNVRASSKDPNPSVHPNPSASELTIRTEEELISVRILNILGQDMEGKFSMTNNTINIENLERGTYILQIELNGSDQVYRFIKK